MGRLGKVWCWLKHDGPDEHDWKEWEYVRSNSCEEHRFCGVCGKEQHSAGVKHVWGEPLWDSDASCYGKHVCQRCKYTETCDRHDGEVTSEPHFVADGFAVPGEYGSMYGHMEGAWASTCRTCGLSRSTPA